MELGKTILSGTVKPDCQIVNARFARNLYAIRRKCKVSNLAVIEEYLGQSASVARDTKFKISICLNTEMIKQVSGIERKSLLNDITETKLLYRRGKLLVCTSNSNTEISKKIHIFQIRASTDRNSDQENVFTANEIR